MLTAIGGKIKNRWLIGLVSLITLIGIGIGSYEVGKNSRVSPEIVEVPIPTTEAQKNSYRFELDSNNGIVTISGLNPGLLLVGDIEGSSMEPTFRDGSYLVVHKVPVGDIKVGDVLVWYTQAEMRYIGHRVIEVSTDKLGWYAITQGDNRKISTMPDFRHIRKEDILGIAVIYILP